jgi:hypothetical protein
LMALPVPAIVLQKGLGVALTTRARDVFPGPMKPDASVRGAPSGRERQLSNPAVLR